MSRAPKPAKTPELAAAEAATAEHLMQRNFEGAARVVAAYEAGQPIPRGIGVNWSNPNVAGDVVALRSILDADDGPSLEIRTAAAMMYLWGVSKPYRRWLSLEVNGDGEATRLLLRAFEARQVGALAQARERGFIP
jgi:hypothetical protein